MRLPPSCAASSARRLLRLLRVLRRPHLLAIMRLRSSSGLSSDAGMMLNLSTRTWGEERGQQGQDSYELFNLQRKRARFNYLAGT